MIDDIVARWLQRYLTAWRSNDPDDIRDLFAVDAVYRGGPFDPEPWIGIDAIVEGWLAHRDEPGTWEFEGEPIAYSDGTGIVEGRTRYLETGRTFANLWVIGFDSEGRARSFVEWFMEPGPVRMDQVGRFDGA